MSNQDIGPADNIQTERIKLMDWLFSKKDAILKASQDIEDIKARYAKAEKSDPDRELDKEAWKCMYAVISAMSELNAYSSNKVDLSTLNRALSERARFNILLESDIFSRFILVLANSITVKWDLKRGRQ